MNIALHFIFLPYAFFGLMTFHPKDKCQNRPALWGVLPIHLKLGILNIGAMSLDRARRFVEP
jgi:hypothetical protein